MDVCIRRRHAYWTTCRCPNCAIDRRRKAKLARTIGVTRVPSDTAWTVVDHLVNQGWSGWAIASAAGLPRRSIEGALTRLSTEGRRVTFGPEVAAALVNHGTPTAGTVGVEPSRRRLRGLAHQGWDLDTLAHLTGIRASTLAMIRTGRTLTVRATTANTIRATTDRIGMQVGPSVQSRQNAERKGWVPLLGWDDIDTDTQPVDLGDDRPDPQRLDEAVIGRLIAGEQTPSSRAERVEALRRWVAAGQSERRFCTIHGFKAGRYKPTGEAA